MRARRTVVFALTVLLGTAASARQDGRPPAPEAMPGTDPRLNNFKQDDAIQTCPLGSLGRVDKRGHGPVPMVLVTGAALSGAVFDDFMERNADRYTMYAVTTAGYGGTPPPPMPEGEDFQTLAWTNGLVDGVVGLIEREGLDRPVVVGLHMTGEYVALRIGLDHPDLVRGVVVMDAWLRMALPKLPRQEGEAVRECDPAIRPRLVSSIWTPFYRTVTPEAWRAGSFAPEYLSSDPARGRALFEEQLDVPLPTQLRYLLEWLTTDLTAPMDRFAPPLLVIQPERDWSIQAQIARNPESATIFFGSADAAAQGWKQRYEFLWGSVEEGVRRSDPTQQWLALEQHLTSMRLEVIPDAGTTVMDDRADVVDPLLAAWTTALD